MAEIKGPIFYNQDFYKISSGTNLLAENIKRVLLTTPSERVNNPEFGCRLKLLLFEYPDTIGDEINDVIKEDIQRWIPNIEVLKINSEVIDDHKLSINMTILDYLSQEAFDYDLSLNY